MLAVRPASTPGMHTMTTTGTSSSTPFACDSGSLEELLRGATLSCPCCNGQLTPEKLERLLDDVQRLARERPTAGNGHDPHPSAGYAGMIIDPHAHMISRTTDDYEAMARAGVVAVI